MTWNDFVSLFVVCAGFFVGAVGVVDAFHAKSIVGIRGLLSIELTGRKAQLNGIVVAISGILMIFAGLLGWMNIVGKDAISLFIIALCPAFIANIVLVVTSLKDT